MFIYLSHFFLFETHVYIFIYISLPFFLYNKNIIKDIKRVVYYYYSYQNTYKRNRKTYYKKRDDHEWDFRIRGNVRRIRRPKLLLVFGCSISVGSGSCVILAGNSITLSRLAATAAAASLIWRRILRGKLRAIQDRLNSSALSAAMVGPNELGELLCTWRNDPKNECGGGVGGATGIVSSSSILFSISNEQSCLHNGQDADLMVSQGSRIDYF